MKKVFTTLAILFLGFAVQAQTNMGINNANPDASAALDVTSTTQGMLVPRMTLAQRNMINMVSGVSTPATGLLIYQTNNTPGFYFYNGIAWTTLAGASTPTTVPNAVYGHITSATGLYSHLYLSATPSGTATGLSYQLVMYYPDAITLTVKISSLGTASTNYELRNAVYNGASAFTEGTSITSTSIPAYSGTGAYPTSTLTAALPAGSLIVFKATSASPSMLYFTQTSTQ